MENVPPSETKHSLQIGRSKNVSSDNQLLESRGILLNAVEHRVGILLSPLLRPWPLRQVVGCVLREYGHHMTSGRGQSRVQRRRDTNFKHWSADDKTLMQPHTHNYRYTRSSNLYPVTPSTHDHALSLFGGLVACNDYLNACKQCLSILLKWF